MTTNLLQLPTQYLLDKIGAGSHKPGSGSAAALNGILSCKLLLTVIELTLDSKRGNRYNHCKKELEEIKESISLGISPRLEELFEEDSVQFDKAIQTRKQRDGEQNQRIKNELQEASLLELKKSTEIPLEISELCIKLGKYSAFVFTNGFQSARGDSGVALGNALAGLSGCISIISLNLQSFPKSSWTDKIQIQKKYLKKEYEILNIKNTELLNILEAETNRKNEFLAEFIDIKKLFYGRTKVKHDDIESLARRIQNSLWKYKDLIWSVKEPNNLLGVLKPEKVIKLLRYTFHKVDTLGVNEQNEEIAGIINNNDFTITISSMYKPNVVNFTTAHELGHALLHNKIELHRDLPLDGAFSETNRSIEEIQADKFAAYFLMPKKIVIQLFQELFRTDRIGINEETALALNYRSLDEFRKNIHSRRDLSRIIADCQYYNFSHFKSISRIFQVSIEAMAIRLEELDLIYI